MRANYANGVAEYYTLHASSAYRNPHYPGILKTLSTFLDVYCDSRLTLDSHDNDGTTAWDILDMAAGSGEVTEAAQTWQRRRESKNKPTPKALNIVATDPYTAPAYAERTKRECLTLSFSDITNGSLPETPEIYDMVICSFALHLLTETSQLWSLLSTLSTRARYLVILAPHKKPAIKQEWGWERVDPWTLQVVGDATPQQGQMGGKKGDGWEIYQERVRLRVWKSTAVWDERED